MAAVAAVAAVAAAMGAAVTTSPTARLVSAPRGGLAGEGAGRPSYVSSLGRTIFAGSTRRSKSFSLMKPRPSAASFRLTSFSIA